MLRLADKVTKKTSWKKPACLGGEDGAGAGDKPKEKEKEPEKEKEADKPAATSDDPAEVPANWRETTDPKTGKVYFYSESR